MNVLVIGNGFDLAHGLETKYTDFLNFINQFNNLYEINERDSAFHMRSGEFMQFLINLFRNSNRETEGIIKELRIITSENVWIKHFNEILEYNEKIGRNWIDFEKEIARIVDWMEKEIVPCVDLTKIESLYSNKNISESMKKNFQIQYEKYNYKSPKEVKESLISNYLVELDNLIRALEIYFTLYIYSNIREKFDYDILSLDLGSEDHIINFNYTDTYNKIYKNNLIFEENMHFIHGKAELKHSHTNNMVLGIDETLSDNEANERLECVGFKYFQRIVKNVDTSYTNIFNKEVTDEKVEVFVFGHSLDRTDKDIIRNIFTADNVVVTVYAYNEEIQKQQVANLINIIGKDELLNSTYRSEPKVKFKLQVKRSEE